MYKINCDYITQAILKHFSKQWKLKQPSDINSCICFYWAYLGHILLNGQLYTFKYGSSHAFIKIGKKYYDCESPNGVSSWKKLNWFQYWKNEELIDDGYKPDKQTPKQFNKFWYLLPKLKLEKIAEKIKCNFDVNIGDIIEGNDCGLCVDGTLFKVLFIHSKSETGFYLTVERLDNYKRYDNIYFPNSINWRLFKRVVGCEKCKKKEKENAWKNT